MAEPLSELPFQALVKMAFLSFSNNRKIWERLMVVPLSAFHTAHSNVKTFIFSIVYFEPHTHFSASNTQTHTHTHLTVCAQQWRSSQEVTEWHNLHKSGFVHFSIHHLSFCKRKRESRIALSIFYLYAMFCAACPLLCCHLKEKQSAISLNVYVHHSHIICLFIIWWVGACVCVCEKVYSVAHHVYGYAHMQLIWQHS